MPYSLWRMGLMQRSTVYIYHSYLNYMPIPIPPWHLLLAEGINLGWFFTLERGIRLARSVTMFCIVILSICCGQWKTRFWYCMDNIWIKWHRYDLILYQITCTHFYKCISSHNFIAILMFCLWTNIPPLTELLFTTFFINWLIPNLH